MTPEFAKWLQVGRAYGVGAHSPMHPSRAAQGLPRGFGHGAEPMGPSTTFDDGWGMAGPDCPISDPLCTGFGVSGYDAFNPTPEAFSWGMHAPHGMGDRGIIIYGKGAQPQKGHVPAVQGVGALGVAVVPMGDVLAFDALVRQFSADVDAWKPTVAATDPKVTPFWMAWDTFRITWAANLAAVGPNGNAPFGAPAGVYGDDNVAKYEKKQAEFNELVRQGKALGVQTAVAKAENVSPFDKLAKDAGATSVTWAKWLFAGAALVALAYVAGPALAAFVARKAVGAP